MHRRALWFLVAFGLLWGCVDNYSGTRMEMNLAVGPGFDAANLVLPTVGRGPGQPGYFSHYELYANIDDAGYVRLTSFIIQPTIHVDSPCLQFIEDNFCRTKVYECDPYMNMERFADLEEIYGVVTVAPTEPTADATNPYGYEHVPGYDFMSWPDELFLDPGLTDPAQKLARENLRQEEVEAFCSSEVSSAYYVGNPKQLTAPRRGTLHGVVDGSDPRTGTTIGGISLWVEGKLHRMTELMVVREPDTSRLSEENIGRSDLLPSPESQVFLIARADESTGYIDRDRYRGVTVAQLRNPYGLPVSMHAVIFEDIDEDPINF